VSGTRFAKTISMTKWMTAVASGVAGATALTAVHELARRRVADAPRMDLLGMRALRRLLPALREPNVESRQLHTIALAGDLVSNSVYYAAVAAPTARETLTRAVVLGTAAGTGALLLPQPMGLGAPPHSDHRGNQMMTVAWYLAGALTAAAVAIAMSRISNGNN
jgi:hypothetical protein